MKISALIGMNFFLPCDGQGFFVKEAVMSMSAHLCISKVEISIEVALMSIEAHLRTLHAL